MQHATGYQPDWDVKLDQGVAAERRFIDLVGGSTYEVKRDGYAWKTGLFYIEYENRGKPSGIMTTRADYWVLTSGSMDFFAVVETEKLRRLAKKAISEGRTAATKNSLSPTKGALVALEDLLKG